jgi:putative ABC transport system substrate-binding protein
MKRREFITLLGGAASAWPRAARAQQPAMPVIGVLSIASPDANILYVAGFRQGLSEAGFVEGRNLAIEYRWAEDRLDRLPAFAADLAGRQVAAIFANSPAAVRAAKAATATIPIVFSMGEDPVQEGVVSSLARPDGNVTGFSTFTNQLFAKRLGLLNDTVSASVPFGLLVNPTNPNAEADAKDATIAAGRLGRRLEVLRARSERDFEQVFATIVQLQIGALAVGVDGLFRARREQLVALAALRRIPTIYDRREFTVSGGLMSYGTNYADNWRQVGVYVGRVLKGEKPANLPVQQATKTEFIINLRVAKALGLAIPSGVLAIADEVIE